MERNIGPTLGNMTGVYHDVVVKRVNTKRFVERDALFRKLVVVFCGVSALIRSLGYTEQDIRAAIDELEESAAAQVVTATTRGAGAGPGAEAGAP